MLPLPSFFIAEHVLWHRSKARVQTTPMQLQKLVYLCHGWMLGIYAKSLVKDPVEAWQYGPVFRDMYHLYKHFGRENIVGGGLDHSEDFEKDEYKKLVDNVLKTYKGYSGLELSAMTHSSNSPWDITVREKGVGEVIDNKLIHTYFMEQFYKFQA